MQSPTTKTPIPRCINLALYASRMMANFTQNPKIGLFSQQMTADGDKLEDAQAKYAAAVKQIVLTYVHQHARAGRARPADARAGRAAADPTDAAFMLAVGVNGARACRADR